MKTYKTYTYLNVPVNGHNALKISTKKIIEKLENIAKGMRKRINHWQFSFRSKISRLFEVLPPKQDNTEIWKQYERNENMNETVINWTSL